MVDVISIMTIVPGGTAKLAGKSTRGDDGEGGKTRVDAGVVVAETSDDGVVVLVPLADGSGEVEVKVREVV